jgi:hypothetical protein
MTMAKIELTDEQFQASMKAAAEAGAVAAVAAFREAAPKPSSLNSDDAFARAARLKTLAEENALKHQWRAFRTPRGMVGVAYITESKTFSSGRVIKFETYEKPPPEQMPYTLEKIDVISGQQPEHFKCWQYKFYYRDEWNQFGMKQGDSLPDVGPPRASLEDAMLDLPERIARRDAAFYEQATRNDPTITQKVQPLPEVVPV